MSNYSKKLLSLSDSDLFMESLDCLEDISDNRQLMLVRLMYEWHRRLKHIKELHTALVRERVITETLGPQS